MFHLVLGMCVAIHPPPRRRRRNAPRFVPTTVARSSANILACHVIFHDRATDTVANTTSSASNVENGSEPRVLTSMPTQNGMAKLPNTAIRRSRL